MGEVEAGPGHTATLAAVGRAFHAESDRPLVVDHLALGLAGEPGATLMAQLTSQLPEASRQSFGLAFAIRTRFVEDAVARRTWAWRFQPRFLLSPSTIRPTTFAADSCELDSMRRRRPSFRRSR